MIIAASEEWFEKYLPLILFNAGEQVYNTYITTKLISGRIQEACSLVVSLIVLLCEDEAPELPCKAWYYHRNIIKFKCGSSSTIALPE